MAAVVFAVAASYVLHPAEHRQAVAAPGGNAAGSILAGSCISMPLRSQLAAAVQGGASVIVATGTLTGKSVATITDAPPWTAAASCDRSGMLMQLPARPDPAA